MSVLGNCTTQRVSSINEMQRFIYLVLRDYFGLTIRIFFFESGRSQRPYTAFVHTVFSLVETKCYNTFACGMPDTNQNFVCFKSIYV